jgi:tetratricopeptide (TPR) repeat protein
LSDGGTDNPKAFDAYLRGIAQSTDNEASVRAAVAAFAQAVALDPKYAFGRAGHGWALATLANEWTGDDRVRRAQFAEARAEAERAVELAPRSGQVYAQLGLVLGIVTIDFAAIDRALEKGIEFEPGNVPLLKVYAEFSAQLARQDAVVAANHAIVLDPLDSGAHAMRGEVLYHERKYDQARESFEHALQLKAGARNRYWVGLNELAAGHNEAAARSCETDRDLWFVQQCLVMAYQRLGRAREADEMLKRMIAAQGDYLAVQYADIYAQRGDSDVALKWLDKAVELHDPGLVEIKVDPFLDPIRGLPRFKEIVEKLKFPK